MGQMSCWILDLQNQLSMTIRNSYGHKTPASYDRFIFGAKWLVLW
jgi:hypothetical protein